MLHVMSLYWCNRSDLKLVYKLLEYVGVLPITIHFEVFIGAVMSVKVCT